MQDIQPRYRELIAEGTPREMGRQIGEAAGEEIRYFCSIALDRINKTVHVTRAAAMAIVADAMGLAQGYSPDLMEELRGMAEAARVSHEDLMLLQIRNQLHAASVSGCTSLAISGRPRGLSVVAQNWDNDPALDPCIIILTRHPIGKPALTTISPAGLIGYIGFNNAGIGVCLNALPAPARTHGVPHYFIVRRIYESNSLEHARNVVREAQRAVPATILLVTPQGPAALEATLDNVHILTPGSSECITHTNHCQHPDLVAINDDFPELIDSYARKARIDELQQADRERPITFDGIKRILRDHNHHPRSICRHTNDDAKTGFWQTTFSVMIEPEARRLHATRGTPCNHNYEIYQMRSPRNATG